MKIDRTGIREWETSSGFHVLEIHYTADPDKRSAEWKAESMRGMDSRSWDREMELNWSSVEGLPVFADLWDRGLHLAPEPLRYVPELPVVRGWDFGLMPCCVWTQFTASGNWNVIRETQGQHTGIRSLCEVIRGEQQMFFPGARFEDFCDPAGFARSQTDEKTCAQVMHETIGAFPLPGAVTWEARRDAVNEWLRAVLEDGRGAFRLDPSCGVLKQGFEGAYHYKEVAEGRHREVPEKNRFSHTMDALQYVATGRKIAGSGMALGAPEVPGQSLEEKRDFEEEWERELREELAAEQRRQRVLMGVNEDLREHLRELGVG